MLRHPALCLLTPLLLFACSRGIESGGGTAARLSVLTENGIGSLRIGAPRNELLTGGGAVVGGSSGCEMVRPPGAPDGLFVMVVDGTVVRFDVTTPGVVTANGVGVGSTEQQVRDAYPWLRQSLSKYLANGHDLIADIVDGPYAGRRFVFETDGAKVMRFRVGVAPQVDWVEGCG